MVMKGIEVRAWSSTSWCLGLELSLDGGPLVLVNCYLQSGTGDGYDDLVAAIEEGSHLRCRILYGMDSNAHHDYWGPLRYVVARGRELNAEIVEAKS